MARRRSRGPGRDRRSGRRSPRHRVATASVSVSGRPPWRRATCAGADSLAPPRSPSLRGAYAGSVPYARHRPVFPPQSAGACAVADLRGPRARNVHRRADRPRHLRQYDRPRLSERGDHAVVCAAALTSIYRAVRSARADSGAERTGHRQCAGRGATMPARLSRSHRSGIRWGCVSNGSGSPSTSSSSENQERMRSADGRNICSKA